MRVGLPKGRLLPTTTRILACLGLDWSPGSAYRLLRRGLDVWLLKMCDIPRLVADGELDLGLAPCDWIEESGPGCARSAPVAPSASRVSLLAPRDAAGRLDEAPPLRVATEYPNLARRFFTERGVRVRIMEVHGSTEAYAPELADVVVDCVETGVTAERHGLVEVERLCGCDLHVIARAELEEEMRAFGERIAPAVAQHERRAIPTPTEIALCDLPPYLRAAALPWIRADALRELDNVGAMSLARPRGERPVYLTAFDRDVRLLVPAGTTSQLLNEALERFIADGSLRREAADLVSLVVLLAAWDDLIRELGLYPGRVYLASEQAVGELLRLVGAGLSGSDALHRLLLEAQALDLLYRFPVAYKFRRAYGVENQCRLNGWGRRLAQRTLADPVCAALHEQWREAIRAHLRNHERLYAEHILHVASQGLAAAPADSWSLARSLPVPILL